MYVRHTELPDHQKGQDAKTLKSLVPFLWEYRGRVIASLAFLILAKVANVGIPLILKDIIDSLDANQASLVLPLGLLLGYGALRLASSLFNELRDSLFARVRHGSMRQVSRRALEHLHTLSLRYHLERKTGGISRDIERGTRSVSSLLNYMVFSILPTLVEVALISTFLLVNYNAWFAVITISSVICYIITTLKITEWRMKYRMSMNKSDSIASTQAVDSLLNYETVKYFGNEKHELDRYNESLGQWENAAVKSQTSLSALNVGQASIIAIAVTLIMILATNGVVSGELTIGDLVLINAFLLQLFIPLNFLGIVYSQLKHAIIDMQLMFNVLEQTPEISDKANAPDLNIGDGDVEFKQVNFSYDSDRSILKDISFTIPSGHKIAIVGPSGSGKSTLARLLFRFYDVNSGSIQIHKQDVREVTQQSLRASIGIVPQDTVLFNDTLSYNIGYARPGSNEKEIQQAARTANIHDFIQSLPDGYQTVVGERGLKLSGGEKQRVAIARAILKNPRILIFDEATSSLDSHSEQTILESLRLAAEHHTTLVIAHRLSTIVDADQILVMQEGRILERGSHLELLEHKDLYAQMWELQKQEELESA